MQTPDGQWRVEVVRRGTSRWYRILRGENDAVIDWLSIAGVHRILADAGVDMAELTTVDPAAWRLRRTAAVSDAPPDRRIQMSRRHPWRAQYPDAVRIDRTTKWGNPFPVDEYGRDGAIIRHREALLAGTLPGIGTRPPVTVADVRRELAGSTVACWCALHQRCHGDTLTAVADSLEKTDIYSTSQLAPDL